MTGDFKNILIIKPSSLGDIALALGVVASLRRRYPDAKITWFVRPEFAPLLECASNVDDTLIFDRRLLGKWWYKAEAFGMLVRLVKTLRRANFDLVVDLQGLFRTALFGWMTGCRKRLGMKTSREFAHIFYTDKISQDDDSIHVIDYYNKVIATAGVTDAVVDYGLFVDEQAAARVKEIFAECGLDGKEYAVRVTGASHEAKCWPIEKFAQLAEKINTEYGLEVVAVGTSAEKERIDKVDAISKTPIVNLAGRTTIPELMAILAGAKVVVGNDTGPGHIAVALGRKTVIIFGPTNPQRIHPYGKEDSIAAVEPFGRGKQINSNDPKYAIEAVPLELVFEKVKRQVEGRRDKS